MGIKANFTSKEWNPILARDQAAPHWPNAAASRRARRHYGLATRASALRKKQRWLSAPTRWGVRPGLAELCADSVFCASWAPASAAEQARLGVSRIGRVPGLRRRLPGMRSTFAALNIGRAIDESGLQVAIVAAVFVSHVLERCFGIFCQKESCRCLAALLALAPIDGNGGARGRKAEWPKIAVA
jgi:hypothetical protein